MTTSLDRLDVISLRSADRTDYLLDRLAKIVPLNVHELRLRAIAAEIRELVGVEA